MAIDLARLAHDRFDVFAAVVARLLNPGSDYDPAPAFLAITAALADVASGKTTRLLINVPPRTGKSLAASVALPAFLLGRDPSLDIICVSYSGELAAKFSRQTRDLMQTPLYRSVFPATVLGGKVTETEFETTRRGGRIATSIGGTLTGRGGDVIVIDDPMKPEEANSSIARERVWTWYLETLLSRLDDKVNGRIVVVMQRLHVDDLAGHLIEQGGWNVLSIPAIATEETSLRVGPVSRWVRSPGGLIHPEVDTDAVYEQIRRDIGSAAFSAQYQQDPLPKETGILDWAWFLTYDRVPEVRGQGRWIASWDLATKAGDANDWSVGIVAWVNATDVWIADVVRVREPFPRLVQRMAVIARSRSPLLTVIEDAGNGTAAYQELREKGLGGLHLVQPFGAKEVRLQAVTPLIEAGRVHLPVRANWLPAFERELLMFPGGANDDQVDALSQLLDFHKKRPFGFQWIREMTA